MAPKDIDPMMTKSGIIYSYKCGRVECDEEYIGESSRTFGERFKEHQKAPSPIFDHFTREERKVINELREDKNRIILTVDKGVSMVVMDRNDYNKKAEELLQQSAYRPLPSDPTNKLKTQAYFSVKTHQNRGWDE